MKEILDIVEDMRERASVAMRQPADGMVHHHAIGCMLNKFADQIEQATKNVKG